jgi:isopenicillin N synthase-like dioxygenase
MAALVATTEVPVLDLSPLVAGGDPAPLARQLRLACLDTGFFYVADHGVPEALVDAMFETAARYFALPEAQRREHLMDERYRRGYVPFGTTTHAGFRADLKERFDWGLDLSMDDPFVAAGRPLHGPNKWPDDLPWFRQPVEAYGKAVAALGTRLLRLIALSLEMPAHFFDGMFDKPCTTHSMIHYPPQPGQAGTDEREFGASQHTDYGLLTLLSQDPIGGLQIRKRNGDWIEAPYIRGTFVINIADLFKMWTNDVYVSNLHRVVNRTGRERYSFPTFLNADYDAVVNTMASCIGPGNPRKYAPVTSGDYLLGRFREAQNYRI